MFWVHFSRILGFLGGSQTASLASLPKILKNHKTSTANTRIVLNVESKKSVIARLDFVKSWQSILDSANAESVKLSCEAPLISPASWCKKSDSRLQ
ncbi:hypothetical protein ACWIUD_07935 [Helicobacter sp. 23-1044]